MSTNLTGAFFTVQSALPLLGAGASIIFTGSVMGTLGHAGYAAYAASKAGLSAMARSLAGELSPRGIRVNVVSPGATRTPIWTRSAPASQPMEVLEQRLASRIPLGHIADVEDVAKAVLFLASEDSSYVTAIELFVDGGTVGTPLAIPALRPAHAAT